MVSFFRDYVTNLQRAQQTAVEKKKNVELIWRGMKETITPSEAQFTTSDIRTRLINNLQAILKKKKIKKFKEAEEKARLKLKYNS